MKPFRRVLAMLFVLAAATLPAVGFSQEKPRVIVMTDGEVDDHSSMIRFLLYTSDVDLVAIIETNSVWQKSGHSQEDWFEKQINAYEAIYPNLIKHRPDYPTAAEIRSKSFVGDEDPDHLIKVATDPAWRAQIPGGAVEYLPDNWADTPGSDKIVQVLLEKNPAPVHIQAWGGGNTASRAFYKLKTAYPDDYARAVSKVIMYNISYQDDAGNYIETFHPGVTMLYSSAFYKTWAYDAQPQTKDFISTEVKTNHGPLGALYPQTYVSEGDSPAFLYTLGNGLRGYEHPTWGGWGGRFVKSDRFANLYVDARDEGDVNKPLNRWVGQANADFAARLDWSIAENYADANHHPIIKLSGKTEREIRPGQTLTLSARGTKDPDGDAMSYRWWAYKDVGTYMGEVSLDGATTDKLRLTVPDDAKGGTLHLILEVSDDATPSLVAYKRIILTVRPPN